MAPKFDLIKRNGGPADCYIGKCDILSKDISAPGSKWDCTHADVLEFLSATVRHSNCLIKLPKCFHTVGIACRDVKCAEPVPFGTARPASKWPVMHGLSGPLKNDYFFFKLSISPTPYITTIIKWSYKGYFIFFLFYKVSKYSYPPIFLC